MKRGTLTYIHYAGVKWLRSILGRPKYLRLPTWQVSGLAEYNRVVLIPRLRDRLVKYDDALRHILSSGIDHTPGQKLRHLIQKLDIAL